MPNNFCWVLGGLHFTKFDENSLEPISKNFTLFIYFVAEANINCIANVLNHYNNNDNFNNHYNRNNKYIKKYMNTLKYSISIYTNNIIIK